MARGFVALVVEDDPGDVLLIEEALTAVPSRRNVHTATDGQEALGLRTGTAARTAATLNRVVAV